MPLDWLAISIGALAAIGGTVAGAVVSGRMALKAQKLQLDAEHRRALVGLRHDKLMEMLAAANRIYRLPAHTSIGASTADPTDALLAAAMDFEDYNGYADFDDSIWNAFHEFRAAVIDQCRAQSSRMTKTRAPWDHEAWFKETSIPLNKLKAAVRAHLSTGA